MIATLANVIWFIFGGFLLGLSWYFVGCLFYITIIGIPIGRACFEFGKLSMFPYGKKIVRETTVKGYENVSGIKKLFHVIVNIIWLPVGIIYTLIYFALGLLSYITIIGIPIGIVYVKMGKFLMFPIGARVVSK